MSALAWPAGAGMLVEPDILPGQLHGPTLATPEKRLMLAVLEEAVGTYCRYLTATNRRGRAILAEVEAWFSSEDVTRLYAFVAICDALGFDAPHLRSGLGLLADVRGRSSVGRERPLRGFTFRRVSGTRQRTTGRPEGVRRRA